MAAVATDSEHYYVRVRPTKAAMVVVGGSIVVAGAALTVLGIEGRFDRSSSVKEDEAMMANAVSTLPLLPTASPVLRPTLTSALFTHSGRAPLSSSTSVTTSRPSLRATTNAPTDVSVPTYLPTATTEWPTSTTEFPTYSTDMPTTDLDTMTTTTTSAGANNFPFMTRSFTARSSTSDAFHLKLYWEQGYLWQESPLETFWCMTCASCNPNIFKEHCDFEDVCQENMMLAIMNCAPKQRQPKAAKKPHGREPAQMATFTVLKGDSSGIFGDGGGDRIQVLNTNLCLQRMGERDVLLKRCDSSVKEQLFYGLRSDNQAMELIPYPGTKSTIGGVETERCLAQHHHPRNGERIYAESCARARNADHHWWVKY